MNWYDCLPAAEVPVPCGTRTHTVRWEAGRLTLPAHPDLEAELVLGALGADKPQCITLTETWASHADDLAVLSAGPRSAADTLSVGHAQAEELRAQLSASHARLTSMPRMPATAGPRMRPGAIGAAPGMEEAFRRQLRRVELMELLALGPPFQFRLAGEVSAAWAVPERAAERAAARPALRAALTGRFAPVAERWLGIGQDAVLVTSHDGPGWGTLELAGTGAARRLRAALPLGWLADVWACGLAVTSGHLVVAVEEPGYPLARVRALRAPDADPVVLTVQAADDAHAGLPVWAAAAG